MGLHPLNPPRPSPIGIAGLDGKHPGKGGAEGVGDVTAAYGNGKTSRQGGGATPGAGASGGRFEGGSLLPSAFADMFGGVDGGWVANDPESFLRENLSLVDLVSLAFMFNFSEAGVLGLGERKAVVQVGGKKKRG